MGLKDGDRFDTNAFGPTTRWRVKQERTLGGDIRTLLIRVERNPIPEDVRCKDCDSRSLYRHGFTAAGVQRYKWRDCALTFIGTDTLKRMRVPVGMAGGLSVHVLRGVVTECYPPTDGPDLRHLPFRFHGV